MIAKPTIHLNGTAAVFLLEGYCNAAAALRAAIKAVQETSPDGRDYYVQQRTTGGSPLLIAQTEHFARVKALEMVLREIEELGEYASDQLPE